MLGDTAAANLFYFTHKKTLLKNVSIDANSVNANQTALCIHCLINGLLKYLSRRLMV